MVPHYPRGLPQRGAPRLQVAAEVAAAPAAQAAVEGDTGAAAPGTLEGPSTLMRCLAARGPRGVYRGSQRKGWCLGRSDGHLRMDVLMFIYIYIYLYL